MVKMLTRTFVKNAEDVHSPEVRQQYGTLSGAVGIFLNLCLFAGKLISGLVSGSIAITADALNNLSDAASSIVTLIGFRMAGRKPDIEHPFGHGRIEYIAGLIVSFIILMMGYELLTSSIDKIRAPEVVTCSLLPVVVLVASILVKLWMAYFNHFLAKKIDSAAMEATAADSRSDAVATTAVLVGTIAGGLWNLPIDGWLGLIVSVLILKTGYDAAKDTISPLLGQPPEQEFVDEIEKTVLAHPDILGIHDLIVHNYGPGRVMVSLHAEVSGDGNLFKLHDMIDNVERELGEKLSCMATIHLDPIDTHNPELDDLRQQAEAAAESLDPDCSVHDVRLVPGDTHQNLIFDVLVPFDLKMEDAEIRKAICDRIPRLKEDPPMYAVIDVDRDYTGRKK